MGSLRRAARLRGISPTLAALAFESAPIRFPSASTASALEYLDSFLADRENSGLPVRKIRDLDQYLSAITDPDDRRKLIAVLIDALDRLDTREVDIVLLAARRMVCLYQLLRERGLDGPRNGEIMSDR